MLQLPGLTVPERAPAGPPILHVDADAFFVSVERRDAPALHGRPVVIGEEVVCCASYEARAQGARNGMLVGQARELCREVTVIAPRWDAYTDAGRGLLRFLESVSTVVEAASLEEAFLDLGVDDWDGCVHAARRIRAGVQAELGLTVSVGVARTKLLAKIATRRAKPDGEAVITPVQEPPVRSGLGIGELWGVGRSTRTKLELLGIESVADLVAYSASELAPIVGTAMARRLFRIAHAMDDARVLPRRPRPVPARVLRRPVQLPLPLELN
jgi:DNA polymerase-4